MIRKIIKIDEEKCNGCGICATACHEGAIGMVAGKAKLLREDYCDGLGDCLPACPADAISFEEREAAAYDHQAVTKAQEGVLSQWPVQIKLVPESAPYFENAHLLIAADCTAFAYAGIQKDFMHGRTVLVGCPKLDAVDYSEKLTSILKNNNVESVHVLRMEVPCCGGMEMAVKKAADACGKEIPVDVTTISIDGKVLETRA